MSVAVQIAMAIGSVVVLLGLMAVVRKLAAASGINAEVQRKLVHIGTGLYALTLPWLFPDRWPVYMLVAITLGVMMVLRAPKVAATGLGSTLHGVDRQSYGDVLLAVSVGLCLFLAEDRLFLYVLPIAVLTLADAAAALAGSTYGTRFFSVENGQKSVEGCVVFFVVTLVISMICLLLMTPYPAPNILVVSLMVAAFGTLVEAASWRGFDNLFLPVGLLIFLATYADQDMLHLGVLAGLFALTLVAFRILAPRLGLSTHASRVYVTTIFLLLAYTDFHNAVLPILVLAAHAWSRRANPCGGAFADLDIVAALALVSFGWLALGNAIGWNAVSFYGITALALALGLATIAVQPMPLVPRLLVLCAVAAGLAAIRAWVVALNPADIDWNGPMWPGVAASVALAALPPAIWPDAFRQDRVAKLTLLAVPVPLAAYLSAINLTELLS